MIMNCCNHTHPFDDFYVKQKWWPPELRCLIVGENPGRPTSTYFYDPPESYTKDQVKVRRGLLSNLFELKLLHAPTLEGFREAGFLFDHAIRCPLPKKTIDKERGAARRSLNAARVQKPEHLRQALDHAPIVWVTGHLACNAVANLTDEFPRITRQIAHSPYPGEDRPNSRFFVSAYITRWNVQDWPNICTAFAKFARLRWD